LPGLLHGLPEKQISAYAAATFPYLWSYLVAIGTVALLVTLHCLCLWLEDRGWLYYRHKKPSGSPMSSWIAMQHFIEPGVKHVVEVKQEKRIEKEEASKERNLAVLVETLRSCPVNVEAVRVYLLAAKQMGLDWQALYEQAVKAELLERPDRATELPTLEAVAPEG
jgi:hypothetical protein